MRYEITVKEIDTDRYVTMTVSNDAWIRMAMSNEPLRQMDRALLALRRTQGGQNLSTGSSK